MRPESGSWSIFVNPSQSESSNCLPTPWHWHHWPASAAWCGRNVSSPRMNTCWHRWRAPSQRSGIQTYYVTIPLVLSSRKRRISPLVWKLPLLDIFHSQAPSRTSILYEVTFYLFRFSTTMLNYIWQPCAPLTARASRLRASCTNPREMKNWLSSWSWERPSSISASLKTNEQGWLRSWPLYQ